MNSEPETAKSNTNLIQCPAETCIAVGREYTYGKGLPKLPVRVKSSNEKGTDTDKFTRILKQAPSHFDMDNNLSNSSMNIAKCTDSSNSLSSSQPEARRRLRSKGKKLIKRNLVKITMESDLDKTPTIEENLFTIDAKPKLNNAISLTPRRRMVDGGGSMAHLDVPPPSKASIQSAISKTTFPTQVDSLGSPSAAKLALPNEKTMLDQNQHQRQYGSGDGTTFASSSYPGTWDSSKDYSLTNIKSATSFYQNDSEKMKCITLPLLKQRLGYLWEKKMFTDVIFIVGWNKTKIEAHRIILASSSEIFQSLLFSEAKPLMIDGKYILYENDFSEPAFEVFIKAMYTNEIPICLTLATALEVFYATKKYGVVFLEDQVLHHIRQLISVSNVFEALRFSTNAVELTYLAPFCWKIIEEQTRAVLEYHLDELDVHAFARILERDRLNMEEAELFQTAVKWAANICRQHGFKTTGKNKRKFMDPLIKHFRFTTMTPTQFAEVVVPSRILDVKEIQQVQSAFIKSNEARASPLPYKTTPRVNMTLQSSSPAQTNEFLQFNQFRDNEYESLEVPKIKSDSAVMIPNLKAKIGQSTKVKHKRTQNKAR